MRAVNLIPARSLRGGGTPKDVQALVYGVVGLLVAGVVLMTMYVLSGNSIAQRRVQLTALGLESQQAQQQVGQLDAYVNFHQLAQSRAQTVRQIAAGNFDWSQALGQLARVVPAGTTLQTLSATVASGTSAPAAASATPSAPTFQLNGCTRGQLGVAQLMSRLRVMSGVSQVNLTSSSQTSSATAAPGASAGAGTCGPKTTTFVIQVGFAAPSAGAAAPAQPSTTTSTP